MDAMRGLRDILNTAGGNGGKPPKDPNDKKGGGGDEEPDKYEDVLRHAINLWAKKTGERPEKAHVTRRGEITFITYHPDHPNYGHPTLGREVSIDSRVHDGREYHSLEYNDGSKIHPVEWRGSALGGSYHTTAYQQSPKDAAARKSLLQPIPGELAVAEHPKGQIYGHIVLTDRDPKHGYHQIVHMSGGHNVLVPEGEDPHEYFENYLRKLGKK